jgi:hypothetical protein
MGQVWWSEIVPLKILREFKSVKYNSYNLEASSERKGYSTWTKFRGSKVGNLRVGAEKNNPTVPLRVVRGD